MNRRLPSGHSLLEHTGELELRIQAPDLRSLYTEAAIALAKLMLAEPSDAPRPPVESVSVEAPDRSTLLVEWLNEIVFRCETRKLIYTEIEIDFASDNKIDARIRGVEPAALRTAVKAATLHRVSIVEQPEGFVASVVLDV